MKKVLLTALIFVSFCTYAMDKEQLRNIGRQSKEFQKGSQGNPIKKIFINPTFQSCIATGISGFGIIWGIKSLFNKDKDHVLSWCAISGGSVGLWYAYNDLKRNLWGDCTKK